MPNSTGIKSRYKLLVVAVCFILTIGVLREPLFSLLSDRPDELSAEDAAGTVIVKLLEDDPFDVVEQLDKGYFIDHKTFRGQSVGTLDTYLRAYLKPVVEAYDEALDKWMLIPVSGENIKLEVTAEFPGDWVGTDENLGELSAAGFFYYTKILSFEETTTALHVQIVDINMPEQFLNMEIRYNLHVFIEGAQVKNSLWKKSFNIQDLPAGVER